jgi:tagaturonate reductase
MKATWYDIFLRVQKVSEVEAMLNHNRPVLNRELLVQKILGTGLAGYSQEILSYPEKVIQFGEGNFLRAFVEWMFHRLNQAGLFQGRVVVVQPIAQGRSANLNAQDGLYTLFLRGIQNNETVDCREVIPTISRSLNAYTEWDRVMACARNPEIEYIISNTTEAGISYSAGDGLDDNPPASFPGKITAYLYHRYQHFQGDPAKGIVVIPCELIERNGSNLQKIVLQLAAEWGLPSDFTAWINNHNHFLNTLVDRIVPGYPAQEAAVFEEDLGYRDQNLLMAEIFHLWVIEGDSLLAERLPFHKAGLNVKWVNDLTPYRTRKVRILNGAHTATMAVAYLSGMDLVREAVNDPNVGLFMRQAIDQEIIPVLDLDREELSSFAADVLERFTNPFIHHRWLDISLNSMAKFQTRVLPSIQRYIELKAEIPRKLCFSLAALVVFYRGGEFKAGQFIGRRGETEYLIRDDMAVLKFFREIWNRYETNQLSLKELAVQTLGQVWPGSSRNYPQLQAQLANDLAKILNLGMKKSLEVIMLSPQNLNERS